MTSQGNSAEKMLLLSVDGRKNPGQRGRMTPRAVSSWVVKPEFEPRFESKTVLVPRQ